ncbi:hypothetical protein G4B88_000122 [Cannabis sativa]|uniref:Pentatricopeptide repeat-containing protein n=1 Tax=Cannabis sativa TaxID=3483 RepID=A0A7J6G0A8_CANSA|nr:hypothetical protein G4B88_000122 [Cannabis sativa]
MPVKSIIENFDDEYFELEDKDIEVNKLIKGKEKSSTVKVYYDNDFKVLNEMTKEFFRELALQLLGICSNQESLQTITIEQVCNVEDALNMFDTMLHLRPLPSVVRFSQLFRKIVKLKYYSLVITFYNQIFSHGIVPDEYTLRFLINCFSHLKRICFGVSVLTLRKFNQIWGTIDMLAEEGFKPDIIIYTTLLNGFSKVGKMNEAKEYFHGMNAEGFRPERIKIICNVLSIGPKKSLDLVPKRTCPTITRNPAIISGFTVTWFW